MNSRVWKYTQIQLFDKRWYFHKNRFAFTKRFEIILRCLKYISPKIILDVGTGDGEMLLKLRTLGLFDGVFIGCDFSQELIKIARKLAIISQFTETIQFIVADIEYLPFRDNQFDSTLCTAVIEHISNLQKAIYELSRVEKKGGISIFTLPNTIFQSILNFLAKLHLRYKDSVFYKTLTVEKLKQYLNKNELIPIFQLNFVLPIPKVFEFIEKLIRRIQKGKFHPFLNQLIICKKMKKR
ncbi:MAG: class I SAM-dependent methyltransferase [Candidatus Helarchaeota archaeon]